MGREFVDEFLHQRNRRICAVVHSENDLIFTAVVLQAMAAESFVRVRIRSFNRFQNGNGRSKAAWQLFAYQLTKSPGAPDGNEAEAASAQREYRQRRLDCEPQHCVS